MMFYLPDGNTNNPVNSILEFKKALEVLEKEIKEKDKKPTRNGDGFRIWLLLGILFPPVAIFYNLALMYGLMKILQMAKGL